MIRSSAVFGFSFLVLALVACSSDPHEETQTAGQGLSRLVCTGIGAGADYREYCEWQDVPDPPPPPPPEEEEEEIVGWESGGGSAPPPPSAPCSEQQAKAGTCGHLNATQDADVRNAIARITDCPVIQQTLRSLHASGKIRVADGLLRESRPCHNVGAYATTDITTNTIILNKAHWDVAGMHQLLRHETGHVLFPNGSFVNGAYRTSEQMAQMHGTCYR
jgi:hypothetical protein